MTWIISCLLLFHFSLQADLLWLSPALYLSTKLSERQAQNQFNTEYTQHRAPGKDSSGQAEAQEELVGELPDELMDVFDFLSEPEKFRKMGAKMPKGVLFVGPPGTGKTASAREIARKSGAYFISASGSEFVNKYVGAGAENVRMLFARARDALSKGAKSVIIFIDEIDALGAARGSENSGGDREYNQTLNQLLTEMDGFNCNENILIIASTNREDILDEALLRPGRFDRRAYFGLPKTSDRKAILLHYCKKRPIAFDINFDRLASDTEGCSGADLKNLVNEAAIEAARDGKTSEIIMKHFEVALKKTMKRVRKKPSQRNHPNQLWHNE